jgi:hypothetical protein
MEEIRNNYIYAVKAKVSGFFKTDNVIIDAIISVISMSVIGYIINYIYDNRIDTLITKLNLDNIKCLFYKKNVVILEGKKSSTTTAYSHTLTTTSSYSSRFKAMWVYIINNIETNKTIYQIKETSSNYDSNAKYREDKKHEDIFIVFQNRQFLIDDDIYVHSEIEQDEGRQKEEKIILITEVFLALTQAKEFIQYVFHIFLGDEGQPVHLGDSVVVVVVSLLDLRPRVPLDLALDEILFVPLLDPLHLL